jgi:hypothetical protein
MLRFDTATEPRDLYNGETADAISAILQESCGNPFETQQLFQETTPQLIPFIDVEKEADLVRRDEALIQRTRELEESRDIFQRQQQTLLDEKAAFKLNQEETHRLAVAAKGALVATEADLMSKSAELDAREEAVVEREEAVAEREAQNLGANSNNGNQRSTLWGQRINRTNLVDYSTISLVNIAHRDMCRSLSLSKEVALRAVERSEGSSLGSRFFEDPE